MTEKQRCLFSEILILHLEFNLEQDGIKKWNLVKELRKKKINGRIITPIFKEKQNGSLKIVMMYAKNARGKMARFLIQNELSDINDLKHYNLDGYSYDAIHSTQDEWCFVR